MIEESKPKPPTPEPIIEKIAEAMISVVPSVKIPSPLGVRMLEQHLRKNQIRLIDLFVMVDRDKNWRLSREEFRKAIQEVGSKRNKTKHN
jgi:Ca2+-binding EF-hand superfamily protein